MAQAAPNQPLDELLALLRNFERTLSKGDLRDQVRALLPVHTLLRELGASLIPGDLAASARERLLHYFLAYPRLPLAREELIVVAAIDQWARRVRELRIEHGWPIVTGATAKQMAQQEEPLQLPMVDINEVKADDYLLIDTRQDRDAAHRWHQGTASPSPTSQRTRSATRLLTHECGATCDGRGAALCGKGSDRMGASGPRATE